MTLKMSKQSSIKAFLDFWRLYLIINKSFKFFVIFKTFQKLGCYKPTTLKRNLVPEIRRGLKERWVWHNCLHMQLGGLPPLKETFVGSLENKISG